jgi:uncharacterized coiled-coil protein SlyX
MAAMSDPALDQRLSALESRLGRLEDVLVRLEQRLATPPADLEQARASLQAWVTDYVSLRLQQLVPETCEHDPDEAPPSDGPVLPGTRIRCTDEVLHRLGRIPIPFVRQMVTQKVVETARAERVAVVDVGFFERAATF